MSPLLPAIAFAVLACVPACVQVALAFGAPLGRLTMGGRWPGRLPRHARLLALVQAGLLALMAWVVLAVARGELPSWPVWLVVGVQGLSVVAHVVTPSRAERRLWLPFVAGMLACAIAVGVLAG